MITISSAIKYSDNKALLSDKFSLEESLKRSK